MKKRTAIFMGIILPFLTMILITAEAETDIQIRHTPLLCAAEESTIEIPFEIISPRSLKEARVYFKKQGVDNFYFVQAQLEEHRKYLGKLPASQPIVEIVEYILLVIDEEDHAVKSPLFAIPLEEDETCSPYREKDVPTEDKDEAQTHKQDVPMTIVVLAEQDVSPEIGFSGENVIWEISEDHLKPAYLDAAIEKQVLFETAIDPETDQETPDDQKIMTSGQKSGLGKKTVIGLGAGAGALALIGVAVSGGGNDGGGGGGIWNPIDDIADNVDAALGKSPNIQTICGTVVSNQLYVTNNRADPINLGTVDYEVLLTTDNPAGSCDPGHTGAFAPGGATAVLPGETVLVRQWSNEVNPCYGCPYSIAECVWESRYTIHTSVGSAIALSTFSAQGDLCGGSSGKVPFGFRNQLKGDYRP